MPYVITTTERFTPDPQRGDAPASAYEPRVVSRVAVATMDEARWWIVENPCNGVCHPERGMMVADLKAQLDAACSGSGGTVGPLPDGTVIEVTPYMEVELGAFTDLTYDQVISLPSSEIIAAYNAAQSK